MKKYLLLIFVSVLFVGCTPNTDPVDTPTVDQTIEVNETTEVDGNGTGSSETNEIDDTTDLFGEESEADVSL